MFGFFFLRSKPFNFTVFENRRSGELYSHRSIAYLQLSPGDGGD
jgi:hypothetical protein